MIPQEFQTAMYAAVSGMVVAGIVKLFNKFVESNGNDLETHVALRKELLENFKMPEVPDIAESDPATYLKFVKRLEALQTT